MGIQQRGTSIELSNAVEVRAANNPPRIHSQHEQPRGNVALIGRYMESPPAPQGVFPCTPARVSDGDFSRWWPVLLETR